MHTTIDYIMEKSMIKTEEDIPWCTSQGNQTNSILSVLILKKY